MKNKDYEAEISRLYWMAVDDHNTSLALEILKENTVAISPRPINPIDMSGAVVVANGHGWHWIGE